MDMYHFVLAIGVLSWFVNGQVATCGLGEYGAVQSDCEDAMDASLALLQGQSRALLAARGSRLDRTANAAAPFLQRKVCHDVETSDASMAQCYPDVMLIGAAKAGSTSIATYMMEHPQVIIQSQDGGSFSVNETHGEVIAGKVIDWEARVFDRHLTPDSDLMEANWATAPKVPVDQVGNYLQLHYSPSYIYFPDTPFHVADLYPNAKAIKYIAILREPVARAVSHWKFHRVKTEHRSFEQSVEQGISQRRALEACYAEALRRESKASVMYVEDLPAATQRKIVNECFWGKPQCHDTTDPSLCHATVDKGVYVDQLRRWFSLFGRDNFFVFSLEEWAQDPMGMYLKLADFAGYSAIGPGGFKDAAEMKEVLSREYNDGDELALEKFVPEPSDEMKEKLREFYEPYDEALFELLGRRLWNTTHS
mmetsp:Transcript_148814/g.370811  ORF Transcript_148814/g.370811 Transcript_148814/m.370811 type:complete len:422 (+) Transcript_148814:86-1351(+)